MIEYGFLIPSLFNLQHYTSSETCLSAFQAPVDPSAVLGGFSGNNYSEVMVAEPLAQNLLVVFLTLNETVFSGYCVCCNISS